jgi:hypothetical protein
MRQIGNGEEEKDKWHKRESGVRNKIKWMSEEYKVFVGENEKWFEGKDNLGPWSFFSSPFINSDFRP